MNQPIITFETFILSLGTAAFVSLGEIEDPTTGTKEKNLISAKQNIDILELLEEKTKGNLGESEEKLLKETIYQARMKYLALKETENDSTPSTT